MPLVTVAEGAGSPRRDIWEVLALTFLWVSPSRADVLAHDKLALTPHIGAATSEAQDRIGFELAAQIEALA